VEGEWSYVYFGILAVTGCWKTIRMFQLFDVKVAIRHVCDTTISHVIPEVYTPGHPSHATLAYFGAKASRLCPARSVVTSISAVTICLSSLSLS
jgi:hypothetical protein